MVTVQPWSIEGHVVQFLQLHRKEPGVARALLQLLVSGNWALTQNSSLPLAKRFIYERDLDKQ